jgi:prepilin-type N-terminal cleavage/methylation domain-containing protein
MLHPYPIVTKCARRKGFQTGRGFTLVELLVVMGIVIILAVASAPSIISILSGGSMNQATMEINGILEQAREYAVAKNTYVWVTFNTQVVNNLDTLTVAVVASNDGTDPGVYGAVTGTNFSVISKIRSFPQMELKDAGSFTSSQVSSLPASPTTGTVNALQSSAVFTIQIPGSGTATFSKSVKFDPSGQARNGVSPIDIIEFALEPAQNTTLPNPNNAAVMRINGLTGQTVVYRN